MNEIGVAVNSSAHHLRLMQLNQLRTDLELNNNSGNKLLIKEDKCGGGGGEGSLADKERAKLSKEYNSSSASGSDISEDVELSTVQEDLDHNTIEHREDQSFDVIPQPHNSEVSVSTRRVRSMSDGSPILNGLNPDGEPFEVFPSLPDSVLEKLGLNGHQTNKERLRDDELEQKFVSLSLAFTIDAATIQHRCERQRRCRDQTETNLNVEIDRLVEKAHRLRPLCVDAETTELLTALLSQVDVIVQAAEHAAIAAERYGAVQHETRLADSTQLMISHVNALKQQRDFARRQLVYTKRVLQDTHVPDAMHKHRLGAAFNGPNRMVTRRRASIATLPHPDMHNNTGSSGDLRKVTRRTSELSLRGNILPRGIRPTRLELGLDLVQIRENTAENHGQDSVPEESEDDVAIQNEGPNEDLHSDALVNQLEEELDHAEQKQTTLSPLICSSQIKYKMIHSMRKVSRNCGNAVSAWLDEGAKGNFFYFCALACFTLSIISLGNILVEMECGRRGSILHWLYNA